MANTADRANFFRIVLLPFRIRAIVILDIGWCSIGRFTLPIAQRHPRRSVHCAKRQGTIRWATQSRSHSLGRYQKSPPLFAARSRVCLPGSSQSGIDLLATEAWWPLHSAFLLGAIVTFALGRYLNRNPAEETIYEKTGPVTVLRPRHTLYFIRMEYWGLIILAIYVVAVAKHQLK